jgi:type I restriction enzyme M protein
LPRRALRGDALLPKRDILAALSIDPLLVIEPVDKLVLTAEGRIVDFLIPGVTRANTPEERVRQTYARKLFYDYAYPKTVMVFAAPVSIGSEPRQADIVIYESELAARQRDQGKAKLVVETKAPNEKHGVGQLKSYIFASSAEGGVWINETDAPKYFRRVGGKLDEWPNIPRFDETWEDIGRQTKGKLRAPHDLVETFKRCHNALYKVGIDSEDLAMDMVRIILAKYQDEQNEGDSPDFRCTPLELQSAEGRKRVAARVRSLFAQIRDEHLDVFDEHETISAGDREIATVVSELQDFRFLPSEDSDVVYDVVGAAYEVYIGSHLKGDRGQYFTHRLIVTLLTRLVDPTEKDTIVDPAMGSGGFLIASMRHITQRILVSNRSNPGKHAAIQSLHRHLFGIDKSPKLVKVARTNMILASDGHAGLIHGDSLEPFARLGQEFVKRAGPGVASVILTNPPFGATSEHRITPERDPDLLDQFWVSRMWREHDGKLQPTKDFLVEGVPPEYLFVERCIKWVAPGGKIGIVVPRGLLDNDKALPLRTMLMQECRVVAVINCHDDTFKPHTDAKAALLVLERKQPQVAMAEEDHPIFMAISQGIGHNGVGQPVYRTDTKGDVILSSGEPVLDQDTEEIYASWLALRAGGQSSSDYYFTIPRSQISANLNLNPVRYLPRYAESRRRVLELAEQDGDWKVERLGQIAQVFNGPRFKRPYADKGVTFGDKVVRYFTGNAITQTRGENIKYLDLAKAKPAQLRMVDKLYLKRGMILITDSGTVGRVVVATQYHDGAIGTNNLIRVVIEDEALRGYVYQFLSSKLGQDQLKANIYGAIVDHIEPDDVKNVFVPVPNDRRALEAIGLPVIRGLDLQEQAYKEFEQSRHRLAEGMGEAPALDTMETQMPPEQPSTRPADLEGSAVPSESGASEDGFTKDDFESALRRVAKRRASPPDEGTSGT